MNFNNFSDVRRNTEGYDSLDCKAVHAGFLDAAATGAAYDSYMYDAEIEPTDVLCGRGKMSFNHVGNRRFRDLIAKHTDKYNAAKTRLEKSLVVHKIFEEVKKIKGRFLKQAPNGQWYELDERQAKEKCGHAIRDAASNADPGRKKGPKRTKSKNSSSGSLGGKPARFSSSRSFDSMDTSMDSSSSTYGSVRRRDNIMMNDSSYSCDSGRRGGRSSSSLMNDDSLQIDSSRGGWDHHDDFEPLHVNSLEAQNSLIVLQNDDFFLQQMDAVLAPEVALSSSVPGATMTKTTKNEVEEPNCYQPFRMEIM